MMVSGVFFALLIRPKPKIAPETNSDPQALKTFEEVRIPPIAEECSDSPCSSFESASRNQPENDAFDYNKILKEAGLPYDSPSKHTSHQKTRKKTKADPVDDPTPILEATANSEINSKNRNSDEGNGMSNSLNEPQEVECQPNSSVISGAKVHSRESAERTAAIRSLKTNFVIITIFCFSNLLYLIPSKTWAMYFCILGTSALRSLLPVATMMANFGTIRSVAANFFDMILYIFIG